MKPDPMRARETLLRYLIYLNTILLAVSFFKVLNVKVILIFNIICLLLNKGIKKSSAAIIYRGS